MVDFGRAFTYFSTSLECMPSTLMATTYLYGAVVGAANTGIVKARPARPARPSREAGIDNMFCFVRRVQVLEECLLEFHPFSSGMHAEINNLTTAVWAHL